MSKMSELSQVLSELKDLRTNPHEHCGLAY